MSGRFILLLLSVVSSLWCRAQRWFPDSLGNGYEYRTIFHPDDYSGPVVSTDIRLLPEKSKRTDMGVLYIHGFNDYFFQKELGTEFVGHGYSFYAVDLRKYGRSLRPGQKIAQARNLNEYFSDIDSALNNMHRQGLKKIVLMGHSTGGLIASYYLEASKSIQKSYVNLLILNSPFLDWNLGHMESLIGLISSAGAIFPNIAISTGSGDAYSSSLLKGRHGEWEYNTSWKRSEGLKMDLGWIRAITKAQQYVQVHPYAIKIPILLMYSSKSYRKSDWSPDASVADAVLDVEDIRKYGARLGHNVTMLKVNGGLHDLILSPPNVRYPLYRHMFDWLSRQLRQKTEL